MSTHVNNPVGPLPSTPETAVTPSAGTEVKADAGTLVQGAGVAGSPAESAALVQRVKDFRGQIATARSSLASFFRTYATGDTHRLGTINMRRVTATPLLVDMLRRDPTMATVDPDVIDGRYQASQALMLVVQDLDSLALELKDTARQEMSDAWNDAATVKAVAERRAKTSPTVDAQLARVRQILANGKRQDTNVVSTAVAAHTATKAQTRAAKAQQRAVAASQSQTRTAQAHAARQTSHGTSPVPLAKPQGPAASADVAPQGPAPVPVPGR